MSQNQENATNYNYVDEETKINQVLQIHIKAQIEI